MMENANSFGCPGLTSPRSWPFATTPAIRASIRGWFVMPDGDKVGKGPALGQDYAGDTAEAAVAHSRGSAPQEHRHEPGQGSVEGRGGIFNRLEETDEQVFRGRAALRLEIQVDRAFSDTSPPGDIVDLRGPSPSWRAVRRYSPRSGFF